MPTDDRWPPTPPREDGRARSGAPDPRRPAQGRHGAPNPYEGYGQAGGAQPGYGPQPGVYGQPTHGAQPGYPNQPGVYGQPASARRQAPVRPSRPPAQRRSSPPRSGGGGGRRRGPVLAIVILLLGLGVVGAGLRFLPGSPFAPSNASGVNGPDETVSPTAPPTPSPLPFHVADVTAASVQTTGFLSWAILDQRSGEIWGSSNMAATSTTMSMIKAGVAADYLSQFPKPSSSKLKDLELMITQSDNGSAERVYNAAGQRNSIKHLITKCGLTDTKPAPSGLGFGYTVISARDAVRMGACIADGRAAGTPAGTAKLLGWMRSVKPEISYGDFGPSKALPQDQQANVAIKNGWDIWHEDHTYRTNCLAIGDTWVVAVLLRYPSSGNDENDLLHNAQVCQAVGTALLNPAFNSTP